MKIENTLLRELINEFIGTAVLILIGDSVLAVIIAGDNESIAAVVGPLGWGVAIFVAVSVAGGVSAHLNPAVTLSLASARKFPLAKVPLYFAAQYLGAFVGAALVFITYRDQIAHFDKGQRMVTGKTATAGIFATYPKEHVSTLTCFIDQVIATGLLSLTAEAITDERNFGGIPKQMHPICLGLMIMALIFGFANNCMCPLNPARDLSPRIFTLLAGWSTETFTLRNWNYVWVPIVGPHIGAILGVWLYKVAIGDHWPNPQLPAASKDPAVVVVYEKQSASQLLPPPPPPRKTSLPAPPPAATTARRASLASTDASASKPSLPAPPPAATTARRASLANTDASAPKAPDAPQAAGPSSQGSDRHSASVEKSH
ncbi:aquaporin-9-like isoform X2 [Haemaphysalis longicornis]